MELSNTTLAALVSTAAVLWYAWGDNVLRIVKCVMYYKFGYKSNGHKVIPGTWKDTRFTRFSHGVEIGHVNNSKYGHLYRVWCGSIPEIVLSDPEYVRLYYQGDGKVHLKRPMGGLGHYLGKFLGESVGLKHNEDWKRLRSHTDPHFSPAVAQASVPFIVSDVTEWLDQLAGEFKEANFKVPAGDLVLELPFKLICRRLFGELLTPELLKELYSLNTYHERMMYTAFFGRLEQYIVANWMPWLKSNKDYNDFERRWTALLHRVAAQAKAEGIQTSVTDMYDCIEAGEMTFDEFAHTIDEILFTNIDVTALSVTWSVITMGENQDYQKRLRKEIDDALANPEYGPTRNDRIGNYLRKQDTLLHYCYLESGRLRPILFYSLPEVTADAKVLGDYYLPPQTSVIVNAHTLNRTSPIWGNDPDAFRPERFMKLNPLDYRYSFWRFGLGPRKCVGMHFGDKIVKSCLMQILERWEVTLDGPVTCRRDRFVQFPIGTICFRPVERS